jgi:DNA-directed RNA polymerase subunit F
MSKFDPVILHSVLGCLKQSIKNIEVDVRSAFSLIAKAMEYLEKFENLSGAEKRAYIVIIVEVLAKGDDGIAGTADDLIPENTVQALKTLLTTNLVEDAVQVITDATKGKLDLNKAKDVACTCIGMVSSFVKKK